MNQLRASVGFIWQALGLWGSRTTVAGVCLIFGWLGVTPGMVALAFSPAGISLSRGPGGPIAEYYPGYSNNVISFERSADLRTWREVARTHNRFAQFPLELEPGAGASFYRGTTRERTPEDDWKNQLLPPNDPFLSASAAEGGPGTGWAKFTIRLDQPDRVYFQDNLRYPFHYLFAIKRLAGFENLSPTDFDEIALLPTGQRLVLGAVILPSNPNVRELGIQIVGRQPFPVSQVVPWLERVRSVMALPADWAVFYLPTFEQGTLPADDIAQLARRGFQVGTPARWVQGNEIYSAGWAYGRLKFVPAGSIANAYATGALKHSDILLTDAVPAEIPLLAATISLTTATPNSHVAILSQSFGVPFVFVGDTAEHQQLRDWDGQEIILLAEKSTAGNSVRTINVQGLLTESQKAQLLQAKQPPELRLTPIALRGETTLPVRELTPSDVRFVGGKAANFGSLMRSVPASTPTNVLAFTFDLWKAFLDQPQPNGKSLRQVISERLQGHTFPPDAARLTQDLAAIRTIIRNQADFTPDQRSAILSALRSFDPRRKLRFRSSTNVEDSEQFSGAGLYDSFSGCLADDTDNDTRGPSLCDPAEAEERGVFRALRRVYASFYNDNAFIERLRHRVDESTVGMAVLVHPSFPDETELANGVATLRVRPAAAPGTPTHTGELVTQRGAVSVSNPEGNARPEVVTVTKIDGRPPALEWNRYSSLVPLGGSVLDQPADYAELFHLLQAASSGYLQARPGEDPAGTDLVLDVEYKKIEPGQLVLKQIRSVPVATTSTTPPPFDLNDAGRLVVFQHHGKDLYANHRLKSIWQFQALTFKDQSKANGFDYFVQVQYHDGAAVRSQSGRISSFPNASIVVSGKTLDYRWSWPDGPLAGQYRMTSTFDTTLSTNRPLPLSSAINVDLSATYTGPQVTFDFDGTAKAIQSEKTRLVPIDKIIDGRLERRRVVNQGKVAVETAYTLAFLKFGVAGIGIFDGKSFPLVKWKGTTITGLTRKPIVLQGEFSQTYDSIRHNFSETLLFEPRLEAGLDAETLAELRAANIKAIRVALSEFQVPGGGNSDIQIWGFDDRLRTLE